MNTVSSVFPTTISSRCSLVMGYITTFLLLFSYSSIIESRGIQHAAAYHSNSEAQRQWALQHLQEHPFRGDERILDIGCGDGKITAYIAQQLDHGTIVGVDVSPAMVKLASETYSLAAYRNLIFMQSDVVALPFYEQFDMVVAFSSLNWVPEQQQALSKIANSLRAGGELLMSVPAKSAHNIGPLIEKLIHTPKWQPYQLTLRGNRAYFSSQEYSRMLLAAGLTPLKIEERLITSKFLSYQQLFDWLRPLMTVVEHLPHSLQMEFTDDLAHEMVGQATVTDDGAILFDFAKLDICASKAI